jgi:hypothetical protein
MRGWNLLLARWLLRDHSRALRWYVLKTWQNDFACDVVQVANAFLLIKISSFFPFLVAKETCGDGFRGNGICDDGTCCSQDGYCGTTAEHCAGTCLQLWLVENDFACNAMRGFAGCKCIFTDINLCFFLGVNETCGDGFRGNGMCDDGSCCSQDGYCGFTAEHCGGESIGTTPGTEIIVPSGMYEHYGALYIIFTENFANNSSYVDQFLWTQESTYDNPSSKVIFGAVGGTLVFVALMFAAVVLPRRIKASRQKQEASHVATLPEVENDVATVLHAEPFFWTTATAVHPVESHATSAVPVHTTDATTVEHWPTFKCQCNNATSPSKVRLW